MRTRKNRSHCSIWMRIETVVVGGGGVGRVVTTVGVRKGESGLRRRDGARTERGIEEGGIGK